MAAKCPGQGAPPETSSEDTAIKHRKGASWDTCNDARYPQITEETESEDEEESTEASEDEYMDEGLGRRVKAVLKGFDKPYNPDLEPAPNLPVYHPSFAKVEYIYSEVVEDAINLLKLSPYKDSQTEALVEYMAARRKIVYSKVKIISMIGDSGVGKSSLINSLLDTPDLATEGASGSACTCVVTEYRQAWPSQASPFAAEVVLFEIPTIETIIKDHFREYFAHYSEPCEDLEPAEQEEGLHLATTALEAFRALFCNHREFATDEAATEFLSAAKSASDPVILTQLIARVKQLMATEEVFDGIREFFADTAEELGHSIERFVKTVSVSDKEPLRASLWPIVRIVRVGLKSKLLESGLIIADLPGSYQVIVQVLSPRLNLYTRAIRCEQDENSCTDRTCHNRHLVQRRLVEGFHTHGTRKMLVCTCIDNMPSKSMPKDLSASADDTEDHESIQNAYKATSKVIALLKASSHNLKGAKRRDITRQINQLSLKAKALNALRIELLIKMRNEKIKSTMHKKYRRITSDPKILAIACVSNAHYALHTCPDGYDAGAIPISIQSTGIPDLRTSLFRFTANSRLDVLRQHLHGILPDMIGSLEVWSSKSATKRRLELREIAGKPRETVEGPIIRALEEIKVKLAKTILAAIADSEAKWVELASKTVDTWMSWHPSSIRAWCCHDGNYATKTRDHVSWNAELLVPVAKDLAKAWRVFDVALEEEKRNCLSALLGSIDSIRDNLKDVPGVGATDMTPFMASLSSKKVLLTECVRKSFKGVEEISRDARLDAVLDEQDSYIMKAMIPLYEQLSDISGLHTPWTFLKTSGSDFEIGPGSTKARKAVFQHAIGRGEPFAWFIPGIQEAFNSALDEWKAEVIAQVQEVFDLILKDFDNMFVVKEVDDPMMNELRQKIKDYVLKANKRIHGEMHRELAIAMGCDPTPPIGLER